MCTKPSGRTDFGYRNEASLGRAFVIYIYIYIYLFIYLFILIFVFISILIDVHIYIHTYLHMCNAALDPTFSSKNVL